ncbi:DUF3311 domain-containing protein [Alicyclobacillus mengziensis]|uniref:DUF3311 domain-containing protein n=1 Tax=Alicyclobacillus mengziensis TaxID=2931921 RepID=A0A9X7W4V3_9BACL|nr:DUF3311 domain-containing protein [Alicyclobacillus mengziensis]
MLIPYLWSVLAIPLVNQIRVEPFGVPFLELWMMAGVLVSSVCVAIVYQIDKRRRVNE